MVNFIVVVDDHTHLEQQLPQLQKNIIDLTATELEGKLKQGPPQGFTPVDEGHLTGAWTTDKNSNGIQMSNSAKYAVYLNEGTGVYGPRGKPITPVKAKVLHWEKGGTHYFAKSVSGVKGQHFVEKSLDSVEEKLPAILQQAVNKID